MDSDAKDRKDRKEVADIQARSCNVMICNCLRLSVNDAAEHVAAEHVASTYLMTCGVYLALSGTIRKLLTLHSWRPQKMADHAHYALRWTVRFWSMLYSEMQSCWDQPTMSLSGAWNEDLFIVMLTVTSLRIEL